MKIKNDESTSMATILDQMAEPRPLPMGRAEFDEWADRIISGALVPGGEEEPEVFNRSLKAALAQMIMHLGPTESHKPDAFFIHSLRKAAVNEVAHAVITEIKQFERRRRGQIEIERMFKEGLTEEDTGLYDALSAAISTDEELSWKRYEQAVRNYQDMKRVQELQKQQAQPIRS